VTLLNKLKRWSRKKSLWVFHVNTGSCNGCDIEILDVFTPRYDAERFGVKLVGSPRHADVLCVTGAITRKNVDKVKTIYEQTPDPKYVVAVGACAASGGIVREAYNVLGGVDKLIPVDVYVYGCPPPAEVILKALKELSNKVGEEQDER
jgi:membrane-bound hydrogenase subunit mbhJ